MNSENLKITANLIDFIEASPTAFHAVENTASILDEAGFTKLCEGETWVLVPGGKYYTTRNMSSIIAFALPEDTENLPFMIMASHTDAPCFKLKTDCETDAFGKYIKLNAEPYGGGIFSSWLDRPLSVAGRVITSEGGAFTAKTVKVDRDLVLIPNVAIHQNRTINSGFAYNAAVDMMPLYSAADGKGTLKKIIADAAGVTEDSIVSSDLFLYNRTPASVWGADNEFFSCPGIDNRQCLYGTLTGFLNAVSDGGLSSILVFASFDNEETGSSTKQGAASPFLCDILSRIAESFGTDLRRVLPSSFMVSADNGHAKHPNHPELSDAKNVPHLNEGVVIKSNAAQKYTTDGISAAIFTEICRRADVPTQLFANRSDMAGGSTLGSISNTQVSLNTVDIGMAQLSMHSAYETGGTADTAYLIKASEAFFKTKILCEGDGIYKIL
ncbi:MAG: M18 family aminopeptidase [Ruminococcaceae bacterium]|nr:M18 family aminopeptidase [Oscillospiraceae bacterium]